MTKSMSCSTSRMPMPSSAQLAQQIGQRLLFQIAQTGGRFIEQQQAGIGRQRAGDLDDALLPQGQTAGGIEQMLAQTDPLDLPCRLGQQARLLGALEMQSRRRAHPAGRASARQWRHSPARSSPAAGAHAGRCGSCPAGRCGATHRPSTRSPKKTHFAGGGRIDAGDQIEQGATCRRRSVRSAQGSRRRRHRGSCGRWRSDRRTS